ncbi:hypothetical protein PR048_003662 [Dryococelus australis]|uniref:Mitochondrial protein n=1 Tax=Dryococelus australis TaxID=614101 RepID=A0ABQ9INP6_9NEOP|nr:hypothetical protein PR048_003662 [Dryococelus australis]
MDEFNAKDVGELQCFNGTELTIAEDRTELSQHKLIDKMLKRFNLQECKGSPSPKKDRSDFSEADDVIDVLYRELVGSLTYLSFSGPANLGIVERIKTIASDTSDKKLVYQKYSDECSQVITFADADWGSDKTDRMSVSGMASFHCGNLVSWSSKKQPIVSLSSAEAEYTSCSMAASDLLYLQGLLSEFVGETREREVLSNG